MAYLPYSERFAKVQALGLCFRCLGRGHSGLSGTCSHCGKGQHNIIVCRYFNNDSNLSSGGSGASGTFVSSGNVGGGAGASLSSGGGYTSTKNSMHTSTPSYYSIPHGSAQMQPNPYIYNKPYQAPGTQASASGSNSQNISHVNLNVNLASISKGCTVLQTASIPLLSDDGSIVVARVLFDTGSDKSYLTSSLSKRLNAKHVSSEYLTYTSFGGGKSSRKLRKLVNISLVDVSQVKHEINAFVIPRICEKIARPNIPYSLLDNFSHLKLADNFADDCYDVDLLIGMDYYYHFMLPEFYKCDNLIAQNSLFGFLLCGSFECPEQQHIFPNSCV